MKCALILLGLLLNLVAFAEGKFWPPSRTIRTSLVLGMFGCAMFLYINGLLGGLRKRKKAGRFFWCMKYHLVKIPLLIFTGVLFNIICFALSLHVYGFPNDIH